MKKRLFTVILAAALVLALASCGGSAAETSATAEPIQSPAATEPAEATSAEAGADSDTREDGVTRIFTDSVGRQLELPAEITRVAVTGLLAQIVLYPLCPDSFVGITSEWNKAADGFFPEEFRNLPLLGHLYGTGVEINLEALAAADPQVVIDIGEPKSTINEDLDAIMEQIGIPVVHVTATLSGMGEAYRKLGELMSLPERAEELAQYCENTYQRTLDIAARAGDNKKNIIYCVGETGLNVIAKDSYHSELIDMLSNNLAVFDNPSSKGTGNETDMEQILLWDPEIIIFAPDGAYSFVEGDQTWSQLSAIQNGSYYLTPNGPYGWMGNPPSINRFMGMIWLADLLYPELTDYDLFEEASRFYELFYRHELTREQFDELTSGATTGLV